MKELLAEAAGLLLQPFPLGLQRRWAPEDDLSVPGDQCGPTDTVTIPRLLETHKPVVVLVP